MNGPDLEMRLRAYYRTCEPGDSARLMAASRAMLAEERRPRHRFSLGAGVKAAASLAVALVLLAVLVLPRLGAVIGPAPAAFDPAAAAKAAVDQAGTMRDGGVWAVTGPYLLTSVDDGATWHAGDIPVSVGPSGNVFVLDPEHAWAIATGDASAVGSSGAWQLTVRRTTDGGRTWLATTLSSPYPCELRTFSFVDASHGFLMCAVGAQPATTGPAGDTPASKGYGTVFRTVDGGETWQLVSHAGGLGVEFFASDADTVWSAEDAGSSILDGVGLYVSRDAGANWAPIDLPGLASIPVGPLTDVTGAQGEVAGGPTFVDADHGALAVLVTSIKDPQVLWFYSTSNGGRSWTLTMKQTRISESSDPIAVLGQTWAITGTGAPNALTVSHDAGASWTEAPGFGLPESTDVHPMFGSLDFSDRDHAAAAINYSAESGAALMLSSDAGRSWRPADFGAARAHVPANPGQDPATAQGTANSFENVARRDPAAPYAAADTKLAWQLLSDYSQKAFGSAAAFESAEIPVTSTLAQYGDPQRGADVLSAQSLGESLWNDLTGKADMTRAYVVKVSFPGTSMAPDTLVVAPLSTTGEWRIWVVNMP
jgi:photosystem II stability/assembly factor-like uncharacterized protein